MKRGSTMLNRTGLARADGVNRPRNDDRQRFFTARKPAPEIVGQLRARVASQRELPGGANEQIVRPRPKACFWLLP